MRWQAFREKILLLRNLVKTSQKLDSALFIVGIKHVGTKAGAKSKMSFGSRISVGAMFANSKSICRASAATVLLQFEGRSGTARVDALRTKPR